jgi:hypothetical protein
MVFNTSPDSCETTGVYLSLGGTHLGQPLRFSNSEIQTVGQLRRAATDGAGRRPASHDDGLCRPRTWRPANRANSDTRLDRLRTGSARVPLCTPSEVASSTPYMFSPFPPKAPEKPRLPRDATPQPPPGPVVVEATAFSSAVTTVGLVVLIVLGGYLVQVGLVTHTPAAVQAYDRETGEEVTVDCEENPLVIVCWPEVNGTYVALGLAILVTAGPGLALQVVGRR